MQNQECKENPGSLLEIEYTNENRETLPLVYT